MPLIVILDDQVTNRRIFEKLAASIEDGVTVRSFAGPREAFDWLQGGAVPDLIVTDYKMPHMNGAEFIRAFREKAQFVEIPIIVITVYEERDFRMRALEAGATDFLQSPVDYQEFVTRARNLLKLRKQQLLLEYRAETLAKELATSEHSREEVLRDSTERLAQVIDTVPAMVSASDRDGRILFANAFLGRFVGKDPTAVVGQPLDFLYPRDSAARNRGLDHKIFETGQSLPSFEEELVSVSGKRHVFLITKSPLRDGHDVVVGVLTSALDITDRKQAEAHLIHLAHHDALTNLPNRVLLSDRLRREVARARRGDRPFALHLIDLDEFKSVNDLLGHSAGDRFLIEVAKRLLAVAGPNDTVARVGGDEFAVLQSGVTQEADATDLANRIVEAIGEPFVDGERHLASGASVGITFHPADGEDVNELLKNADLAMYRAKSEGGNQFCLYVSDMAKRNRHSLLLDGELRDAIAKKQFVLYYQPQIDLESGRVVGAEALLRWNHPEHGILAPGEFLSRAEKNGLIVPINEWVLYEACREAKSWHRRGLEGMRIAVNLSPVQFRRLNVPLLVVKVLADTGLDPRYLDLEITENIVMDDTETVIDHLKQIHALGVSISIDDFGTGYSALNYVKRFPIDRLKIDQCFVRNLSDDPSDMAIVRAIVNLGHSLELTVTAEGVETEQQAALLQTIGCDEVQGHLYGRAMPADRFVGFALSQSHRLPPAREHR